MAWEIDRTYKLKCEKCGRTGRQIEKSDDWNNHATYFEDFDSTLSGGGETDAPNNGVYEVPICPVCGNESRVSRT